MPHNDSFNVDNLLSHPTLFSSPVETLAESILEDNSNQHGGYITLHDLTEAYNVLCNQLQSQAHHILASRSDLSHDDTPASFKVLKDHATQIAAALTRDLGRLTTNPGIPVYGEHHAQLRRHDSSLWGSLDSYEPQIAEESLQAARDFSVLGCQAICFLAEISVFPALLNLFTPYQTGGLIDTLLDVGLKDNLPTFDSQRTFGMVVWTLKVQQFPTDVLKQRVPRVVSVLQRALCGEYGGENTQADALHAIHSFSQRSLFLDSFYHLLPIILPLLTTSSPNVRHGAAYAVGSFAQAALQFSIAQKNLFSLYMHAFLSFQTKTTRSTRHLNSSKTEAALQTYITRPFSTPSPSLPRLPTDTPPHPADSKAWSLSVLASLITLADSDIFENGACLRVCLKALALCRSSSPTLDGLGKKHPRGESKRKMGKLQGAVWKGLVWAFGRMPLGEEGVGGGSGIEGEVSMREKAFRVVKQELRDGVGRALVATLLLSSREGNSRETPPGNVEKALEVVYDLATSSGEEEKQEAEILVRRLVSGIGNSVDESTNELENSVSFGSQSQVHDLAGGWSKWRKGKGKASTIPSVPSFLLNGDLLDRGISGLDTSQDLGEVVLEDIRPLEERELLGCWEACVIVWVVMVKKRLSEGSQSLSSGLLQVWQALLLVQGQLAEDFTVFTAKPEFACRIADIICQFLVVPSDQSAPLPSDNPLLPPAFPSPESQVAHLSIVLTLFTTVTNVFAPSFRSGPAGIILTALLDNPSTSGVPVTSTRFDLDNAQVKKAWKRLCAALVGCGVDIVMHIVENSPGKHRKPRGDQQADHHIGRITYPDERKGMMRQERRTLWEVMAWKCGLGLADEIGMGGWEGVVGFLSTPLVSWTMSEDETELWDGVLREAILMAGRVDVRTTTVVMRLVKGLGEDGAEMLSRNPKVLTTLLSYVDFSDGSDDSFPLEIFEVTSEVLVALYPPRTTFVVSVMGDVAHVLEHILVGAGPESVARLLMTMQQGFRVWIADESCALYDVEQNNFVKSLYCTPLKPLQAHPGMSASLLSKLSPFLSAAFVRVPKGAKGPLAFERFWRAIHHDPKQKEILEIQHAELPEELRICLKAFADAYGGDLASGFGGGPSSLEEESFRTHSSVPDSEPGHDLATDHSIYFADSSHFVAPDRGDASSRLPPSSPPSWLNENRSSTTPTPVPARNHSPLNELFQQGSSSGRRRKAIDDPFIVDEGESLGVPLRPLKRRRTEAVFFGLSEPPIDFHDGQTDAKGKGKKAVSEPVTRLPTLDLYPPGLAVAGGTADESNPSRRVATAFQTFKRNIHRQPERSPHTPPNRSPQQRVTSPLSPSSNDYDQWELAAPSPELRRAQRELLPHHTSSPNSSAPPSQPPPKDELPRLHNHHNRPPEMGRSETAPVIPQLQRTPLRRSATTSSRLEALQKAFAAVTEDGASQVPVADLVHAAQLVHQIGAKLGEQMSKRFGGGSADGGGAA